MAPLTPPGTTPVVLWSNPTQFAPVWVIDLIFVLSYLEVWVEPKF